MSGKRYKDVLSKEHLQMFIEEGQKFEKYFCELIGAGSDFNLLLEVRGNHGEMVHCRVKNEGWRRPKGKKKEADKPSSDRTTGG